MSWNDSDDDEPITKPTSTLPNTKQSTNWDDSEDESDADEATQSEPHSKSAPNTNVTSNTLNDWNQSDESEDDETTQKSPKQQPRQKPKTNINNKSQQNNGAKPNKNNKPKREPRAPQEPHELTEDEKKKLQKLQQQQRKKPQPKPKKNKSKTQTQPKNQSIPKNQDEIVELSSSDSDSSDSTDDATKSSKKPKMETYEQRMKTDNDILFQGHEAAKQPQQTKPEQKVDTRPVLSGEVKLKEFPLGSSRDCENFAGEIGGVLHQNLFEEKINTTDVCSFLQTLLGHAVIDELDMVDIKALTTKMTGLLKAKQKAYQTKKNPKGKKKKKPQWIVSGSKGKASADDEYSLFDL